MGAGLWIFFIEEDDIWRNVDCNRFARLSELDPCEVFPEYANKRVRTIIASGTLNKDGAKYDYLTSNITEFDAGGRLSNEFIHNTAQLVIEQPKRSSNVINAAARFVHRKYELAITDRIRERLDMEIYYVHVRSIFTSA